MKRRGTGQLPLQFHDPAFADFRVDTIAEDDVLSGEPIARHAPLERAGDGTEICLRDYSAGRFRRHYDADEVVHVVEGVGGVIDANHRVWSLRPGDTVTFRNGTEALWQIPEYLRVLSVTCPARKPPLARRALQAMGTATVVVASLTLIGVTTIATVAASMMGS
jgi:uncharacterized cupin superfamily protein